MVAVHTFFCFLLRFIINCRHLNMSEPRKAVIKNADMTEEMQQEAVDCASEALNKFNIEKASA